MTPSPSTPSSSSNPSGVNLRLLLEEMIDRDASDLHVTAGERPKFRIDGDITNSNIEFVMQPKDTLQLAYSVLTENQKKRFEMEDELDFSFGIQNLARFRGNCFKQRGCVSMVIRQIPFNIRSFEDLGLPKVIADLADKPARPDSRHRPDGLREVDDARRDARPDQQAHERPHHHDRGSDRVHSPASVVHRQPARGRLRHQELRGRAQVRAPSGPGRRAHRRNARPRDDPSGPDDRRDGSPRVRDAAHEQRGRGDQPHHRRLSEPPAVAGARPARVLSRGHHHADAAAQDRAARAARWRRRFSS